MRPLTSHTRTQACLLVLAVLILFLSTMGESRFHVGGWYPFGGAPSYRPSGYNSYHGGGQTVVGVQDTNFHG